MAGLYGRTDRGPLDDFKPPLWIALASGTRRINAIGSDSSRIELALVVVLGSIQPRFSDRGSGGGALTFPGLLG